MPTYNNQTFLSLPQQVQKNKEDIASIQTDIKAVSVGPQGATGPQGPQGIQGNTGPAGPDGTPVAGLSATSEYDAVADRHFIDLADIGFTGDQTKRFVFNYNVFETNIGNYILLFIDDVDQGVQISPIDFVIIRRLTATNYRMQFYDVDGQIVTTDSDADFVSVKFGARTTGNSSSDAFSIHEIVNGSTVGPTGPAGATGSQGETGPTGAQGIQGLPGEQNLALDDTYTDGESFPEYTSQIMIQIIGGDYDGMTFIKESLEEDDVVKFGPYAQLITITDPGTGVQINLLNGVTSVKIYTMENLT